jgi:hypothetical protein
MASTEYVVGVKQGNVYDFYNAGSVTTPTLLSGGTGRFASTTNLVGMAVVDHTLYMGDGVSPNCRFNGVSVNKAGSAQPTSAPVFSAFVGSGVMTGDVTYKIVYLDADEHESEPSIASAVLSPSAQNITLTLPNATDADRVGKNLYRRGVESTEYKLVNSTPISPTATTYTDSTTDAGLGEALVDGNTLFPPCARLWEHDNRLFGCGNADDLRTLFISNTFEPWYSPASPDLSDPNQGLRLRVQAKNAVIVGGISHGGYCFVFTDEGGYILHGTSSDDYRLERFTSHGCAAHRTIQSVRNWLIWCGVDGVYRYDGAEVIRIDDSIRTFFNAQTAANLVLACAWNRDDRYYLSFPTGSNGKVKCFDTRLDPANGWTTMSYPDIYRVSTSANSLSGNPGPPRVFVADGTSDGVVQLEKPATLTDARPSGAAAVAITPTWRSKQFNMGQFGRDKRVHLWGAKFKNPASGSGNVTLTLAANGDQAPDNVIQTETEALSSTSTGDDWSGVAAAPKVTASRNEGVESARSELFQINITGSTQWDTFRILEVELYWSLAG